MIGPRCSDALAHVQDQLGNGQPRLAMSTHAQNEQQSSAAIFKEGTLLEKGRYMYKNNSGRNHQQKTSKTWRHDHKKELNS